MLSRSNRWGFDKFLYIWGGILSGPGHLPVPALHALISSVRLKSLL